MSDDYVTSTVTFKARTDNAVLIAFYDEEAWVPRSCLSFRCDRNINSLKYNDEFEISLREWKASQIGLQY